MVIYFNPHYKRRASQPFKRQPHKKFQTHLSDSLAVADKLFECI